MKPMNDRTQLEQPRPAAPPTPRNRFRIEKLEARIAPSRLCKGPRGRTDPYCYTSWKC